VRIIGVIDLKDGQAVHARGGRRDEYALVSEAAGTVINGDAVKLAGVYREIFGLTNIYVADLDAIGSAVGRGPDKVRATTTPNVAVVRRICKRGGHVFIDDGVATLDHAHRVAAAGAHEVIVGLETLTSFDLLRDICRHCPVTFSLDLRNGIPMNGTGRTGLSPEDLAREAVAAGAKAIIVLDVARVGGTAGPDTEMLNRIRPVVTGAALLAGGGVRGLDDLKLLDRIGCDGALIATALHDGRLTASDVAAVTRTQKP
jgi:phosphoribosylformimino-5-aminoimidazole carboxamide ribotide isomerase